MFSALISSVTERGISSISDAWETADILQSRVNADCGEAGNFPLNSIIIVVNSLIFFCLTSLEEL